eukprot:Skav223794  [mRNA]  locus=scaffold575:482831:485609:+ [translate_table: standard]
MVCCKAQQVDLQYRAMALRYLNTFLDEEPVLELSGRSKSWPQLRIDPLEARDEAEKNAAQYVAELNRAAVAAVQVAPAEVMAMVPVVADVSQDAEESATVLEAAHPSFSPGSRGHPFLCRRPCVRLAKGGCEAGAACGFCHHNDHARLKSFDRQQRKQLQNMDAGGARYAIVETADLLAALLPHVRRSAQEANLPKILEIIEGETCVQLGCGANAVNLASLP